MKKAWEREYEMMQNAKPIVLKEDEQGWLFSEQVEKIDDTMLKMKWKSNVPGSNAPERVIIAAIADMESMGYDVTQAEALIDEGLKAYDENDMVSLNRITCRIWNILNNAKHIEGHSSLQFKVYDTFEKYLEDIDTTKQYKNVDLNSELFKKQTYYGWLAQICAGAVGTAVEGYTTKNIYEAFGDINDYVREPNTYNDDITYEFAFLKALERKGKNLEAADIAEEWVALVPFGWSAEEWALKNIKSGIYPPESGYLHNPYREWIGAQMRGAVCGMVAPSNPLEAARLAFMDGTVSHYNNGVLGEIFNAVMVSLAYTNSNVREIVEQAIEYIPSKSEYYTVVKFALDKCKEYNNWRDAWHDAQQKYKRYNWIHAYPNAAAEVIALWFGEENFDKTINIICMEGYDVDCNAAQIATVIGIINCENTLQKKWTEPIGDQLKTYMRDNKIISIKWLADYTVNLSKLLD